GGMNMTPVAAALDKVPIGTWAEYQIKRGEGPPRKLRHALVGKSGSDFVVESRNEGPRGKMITQTTVTNDPAGEGAVKKVISQMGDQDPMEMPLGPPRDKAGEKPAAGEQRPHHGPGPKMGRGMGRAGGMMGGMNARFLKPDPKALVGKETVTLAAGTFTAEHYRQTGPRGGTVDFWINKDVGPFGLVKMEVDRPGGPDDGDSGKVTFELSARGTGAKAEITKPAKPFDPAAMPGRWGRGPGPKN
ncbi:MAG TPA: hypothetical protein VGF45_12750, partial [Polyangia bacterium]